MSRGERGEVSLIGVLVACSLMVVILGATLGLFEGFIARASDSTQRTSSEDAARTLVDRIARELRNLASPTPEEPKAVDRNLPGDLIFKTVDAAGPNAGTNLTNTKRVRYCVDTQRKLFQQTQTWITTNPPLSPSDTACPGSGWTTTAAVATRIVNGAVPVFTYNAAVATDITEIHVDLLVDADPVRDPPATRLSTGVFLRNQNRRPAADFTATRTAGGLVLNGSASADPEGDPLTYTWFDGGLQVGSGITFSYTNPPLPSGSVHQIRLVVADPTGLTSEITKAATA